LIAFTRFVSAAVVFLALWLDPGDGACAAPGNQSAAARSVE
jgi:hypothetical protein